MPEAPLPRVGRALAVLVFRFTRRGGRICRDRNTGGCRLPYEAAFVPLPRARGCATSAGSRPPGCGRGGIGRHARFRFWWRKPWGFKSLRPHHRPAAWRAVFEDFPRSCRLPKRSPTGSSAAIPSSCPPPTSRAGRAKRLADLGKTLRLPGFRPGKVPTTVVHAALRQRGHRRGAGGKRQRGHPAGAERARPARRPASRRSSWSASSIRRTRRTWSSTSSWNCCPEIALPDFAAIELTRLKAEPSAGGDRQGADRASRAGSATWSMSRSRGRRRSRRCARASTSSARWTASPFPGGTGTDVRVEVGGGGFIPGFTEQLEGLVARREPHHRGDLPGGVQAPRNSPASRRSFDITAKTLKRAVHAGGGRRAGEEDRLREPRQAARRP